LVNQIADAEKRQSKAQAALDGLDGEELVVAEAALAAAETTTADLRK